MLPTDFQDFFVKYLYILENGKYLLNFPEFDKKIQIFIQLQAWYWYINVLSILWQNV
jgi:hypothetical protein